MRFASIFVKLLLKKATRKARKVYDSEVFKGEVCSGTDIAVFFSWLVLSTMLLFCAPFCVHMTLCGDVYTVKHSMYDSFLLSSDTKLLCGSMQTDSRLVNSVSTFSRMTVAVWPARLSPPAQSQISAVALWRH